jgi:hypothetical protein
MYLSPDDIRQTRLATLDNLLAASQIWVDASGRFADLGLRAGRHTLEEGRGQLEDLIAQEPCVSNCLLQQLSAWRGDSAEWMREAFEIIGDAQQGLLATARDQVATLDTILLRQMDRAALSADATGEAAIDHVKQAIREAEAGFKELTDAAARGTDMVEEQIRQVSEAIAAEPGSEAAKAPRSRRTRS